MLRYHDGQIVWVKQCDRVNIGEVGIFIYDGEGYIKVYDEQEPDEEQQEAFSLEKAFEQLEETIKQLEQEDVSLEKSFEIYQAGMKLLKKCNESIDRVEKQVLVLQEDGTTYELS